MDKALEAACAVRIRVREPQQRRPSPGARRHLWVSAGFCVKHPLNLTQLAARAVPEVVCSCFESKHMMIINMPAPGARGAGCRGDEGLASFSALPPATNASSVPSSFTCTTTSSPSVLQIQ